jgi:hypothetical protein
MDRDIEEVVDSMGRISDDVVAAVLDRANYYCEVGGSPLGSDFQLHHRKNRGKGGKGFLDFAENLLAVHAGCHQQIHASPERSYVLGWLVHTNDNPAEIPVRLMPGLCSIR